MIGAPDPTEVLAALLDRSVARIAELTADGPSFDRTGVVQVADVWCNNSGPLFGALTAPRRQRAACGRTALEWMAALGSERRQWVVEQAAVAGYSLETLPPAAPERHRDCRGLVHPGVQPLSASLGEDYDLGRACIDSIRVERAGAGLRGYVGFEVPRRYGVPGAAKVQLYLTGVGDCRFDDGDGDGVALTVGEDGADVKFGHRGFARAASAEVTIEDSSWHLSRAGRVADATTPPWQPQEETGLRQPSGAAYSAAFALYEVMLRIRMVRYAKMVGAVPLAELAELLADAGSAARSAARRPWGFRERAFARLAERWSRRVERPHRPPAAPGDHLTLAGFGTGVMLNSAVRNEKGTWELRSAELPRPERFSLTVRDHCIAVDGEWSNEAGHRNT
uniref:hypothetical protein n=1 Tax=Paractinoplanes polyasparticus TaxID=2856853 RepID=UPI001C8651BA|nr:hypothetical protein [Actinoplanes polyasparticus]